MGVFTDVNGSIKSPLPLILDNKVLVEANRIGKRILKTDVAKGHGSIDDLLLWKGVGQGKLVV